MVSARKLRLKPGAAYSRSSSPLRELCEIACRRLGSHCRYESGTLGDTQFEAIHKAHDADLPAPRRHWREESTYP
jgi:hypothetical protein